MSFNQRRLDEMELTTVNPEKFLSYIQTAKREGRTETQIAKSLGMPTSMLRYLRTKSLQAVRKEKSV